VSAPPFGAPVLRREDRRLLTGQGRYVSDVTRPRMLHVAFVRSVHAHATLRALDVADALATPGVVAVIAGDDPEIAKHRIRARSALTTYVETDQPVLAWPRVRHVGEAIAAVVATDPYAAADGAERVAVDYAPLPAVVDAVDGAAAGAPLVHDEVPGNVFLARRFEGGDVDGALARAAIGSSRSGPARRSRTSRGTCSRRSSTCRRAAYAWSRPTWAAASG
jgi:carbon-monoxide dehydrogenase large subunit